MLEGLVPPVTWLVSVDSRARRLGVAQGIYVFHNTRQNVTSRRKVKSQSVREIQTYRAWETAYNKDRQADMYRETKKSRKRLADVRVERACN